MIHKYYSSTIDIDRNLTDLVKFLSCIMVAMHHYAQYVVSNGISNNVIYKAFSAQGGYLGVAVFFFLSGYGLMKSDLKNHLTLITFIKKRLVKILMPVLLITIIWLPIYYSMIGGEEITPSVIIKDLLWGWQDGALWFIKCLLGLYLNFGLYSIVRTKVKSSIARLFILCGFALFSFALQCFYVSDFTAISVPLFYIGIAVVDFKESKIVCSNWSIFAIVMVMIFGLCVLLRHNALFIHAAFNYIIVLIWVTFSSRWIIQIPSIPKWLNTMSFDVYLTHMKCLKLLQVFMPIVPVYVFIGTVVIVTLAFDKIRTKINI